jgi:hypothetical protein
MIQSINPQFQSGKAAISVSDEGVIGSIFPKTSGYSRFNDRGMLIFGGMMP